MHIVLLVEDDAAVRGVLRQMLLKSGYGILEASGAAEAIEVAAEHCGPIHLLITDVVLPQAGSQRLVERLVGQRPDLRILYISGYSGDILRHHGLAHTEPNFLQKPFTAEMLEKKIQEVLDAPRNSSGYTRSAGACNE